MTLKTTHPQMKTPLHDNLGIQRHEDAHEPPPIAYNNLAKAGWASQEGITLSYQSKEQHESKVDYSQYMRFFPGSNEKTIEKTFKATTQFGWRGAVKGLNLRNQIKSPNPAINILRRNEPVTTDTIYATHKAIDNGLTAAQYYHGRYSNY